MKRTSRDACPCSGINLARLLRPAVLSCLARSDMHGYRLAGELEEMHMFESATPDLTGLYRCLRDMEQEGLIAGVLKPAGNRRERCLFSLTTSGLDCLIRWQATLNRYEHSIRDLKRRTVSSIETARRRKKRQVTA